MSRVLARTSMISDDRMLNDGDQDDQRQDDEHRDPLDLQRLEQGRVHLLPVDDDPPALHQRLQRREDFAGPCRDRSVWISIMPTSSPIRSSVCASCIGMTTKALS